MSAELAQRLSSQVQLRGWAGTVRLLAEQLLSKVAVDESHVWYDLDLTGLQDVLVRDDFQVRRGTLHDVHLLGGVPPVSRHEAVRRLEAGHDLWLALDGADLAFCCWVLRGRAPNAMAPGGVLRLPDGVVNLEDSVTVAAYRGRGIAVTAWTVLAHELRAEGLESLVTRVAVDNVASRRAVSKAGFVEVAEAHFRRTGPRVQRSVSSRPGQEDTWFRTGLGV